MNIEKKLDQLSSVSNTDEELMPVIDSSFTGESEVVAGLGSIASKIGKKIGKTVVEKVQPVIKTMERTPNKKMDVDINVPESPLPADELTEKIIDRNVIEKVPPKTKVQKNIQKQIDENPTITPEELAIKQDVELARIQQAKLEGTPLKPGEFSFNYDVLNTTDDVSALIEANANLLGIKANNIKWEDVIESSQGIGLSKNHIEDLLTGKLKVNPELAYKTNELIKITQNNLAVKLEKVRAGEMTEQGMVDVMKEISLNGVLLQQARQYKTNIAQSLGILRAKVDNVQDISQVSSFKNPEELKIFADKYLNASKETQNKLIDGVTKGFSLSKLSNIYVGGLVSRPSTHFKNIFATALAIPLRWANKAGAAAMDVIRVSSVQDQQREVFFSEVMSEIFSTGAALKNGFAAARYATKNGKSINALDATKFEGTNPFGDIFDIKDGSPFSFGLKFFNFTAAAANKALFMGDEFVKGVNYTYELESHITRQSIKAHNKVLKEGGDLTQAASAFDDVANSIYDNPPSSIHDIAAENAFLKPLDPGMLKNMENLINSPTTAGFFLKTQIPFFKTPTNLYSQTFEQIPLLALVTKKARQDLSSGDPARVQLALSKQSVGLGLMYIASQYASDGDITGPGPKDVNERKLLEAQGWKPYSFVIDTTSKKFEDANKSMLTKGTGNYEGKYFLSYEGLEPVGALLAIGASYADYARYEDDPNLLNSMIYGVVPALAEYATNHPLLDGVNSIGKFFDTIKSSTSEDRLDTSFKELISGAGVLAYKSIVPLSGLQKSVREKTDEYKRDYKVESQDYKLMEGVLEAQNKILDNLPFGSDDLPQKINIWGEPLKYEDAWRPLRASKGKALEANEILINTRTPYGAPTDRFQMTTPDGVSVSVKFTPQEYKRMIEIANFNLKLPEKIIETWKSTKEEIEISAQTGTEAQLQKLHKVLLKTMNDTFNVAKKQVVTNSKFSNKIKQRIEDEANKIRNDIVE